MEQIIQSLIFQRNLIVIRVEPEVTLLTYKWTKATDRKREKKKRNTVNLYFMLQHLYRWAFRWIFTQLLVSITGVNYYNTSRSLLRANQSFTSINMKKTITIMCPGLCRVVASEVFNSFYSAQEGIDHYTTFFFCKYILKKCPETWQIYV